MDDLLQANMDEYLPLRDVVFNTLRQAILTGRLKPGERLMELHLADRMGVSRTPIREAIRKLELEGLVIMIPRRGAEVAKITEKGLRDVLEVRRALDALAVELACDRMTEEDKNRLQQACDKFEQSAAVEAIREIAEADVEFHDIIVASTGNERLIQLVNNLAEQMYRYRFECLKDASNHLLLLQEHKLILKSIFAGNKTLAAETAKKHINTQEDAIIKALQLE